MGIIWPSMVMWIYGTTPTMQLRQRGVIGQAWCSATWLYICRSDKHVWHGRDEEDGARLDGT